MVEKTRVPRENHQPFESEPTNYLIQRSVQVRFEPRGKKHYGPYMSTLDQSASVVTLKVPVDDIINVLHFRNEVIFKFTHSFVAMLFQMLA